MLLQKPFEAAARARPEKTALVCGSRRLTYGDLAAMSNRLAYGLIAAGVRPGDRVAVCLPNGPEVVATVLAAMKAGGVFVVINPAVKTQKLEHILDDCDPRVFIADRGPDRRGRRFDEFVAAGDSDSIPGVRIGANDLCCLVYTSGSTGLAKGVMMTHENAVTAAFAIEGYLHLTADDVVLNFSPMAADYGLYNVLMSLRVGATSVLERGYVLPSQILELVKKENVTGLALLPTIIAMFLQADGLEAHDFGSVRFLTSTGQVLPPAHIARLRRLLPDCDIYSMYGLTECKRVSFLDPAEIDRRPTSVGKAMAGTEAWIVDDQGDRILEPGVVGELVIRGRHVMQGYWNLPEETAASLRPDPERPGEKVLYSGDWFEMDEEGFLYFVSRKDDLIKSSGERISPREIEDCIYELEGVTGVLVTAVPDEFLGHAIRAVVAIASGSALDAHRIRSHCAENLERALVPKTVEVCDSLPQTPSGKLRKR